MNPTECIRRPPKTIARLIREIASFRISPLSSAPPPFYRLSSSTSITATIRDRKLKYSPFIPPLPKSSFTKVSFGTFQLCLLCSYVSFTTACLAYYHKTVVKLTCLVHTSRIFFGFVPILNRYTIFLR